VTLRTRTPDAFSPGKTPSFEESAKTSLDDPQLRRNLGKATQTIRSKRTVAVEEIPDWEELREAGRALKTRVMRHLDEYLLQLEESVTQVGGHVHWARDAGEANRIIAGIVKDHGAREVVKVKSIATDETKLNEHLEREGIRAFETDLAELLIQLAGEPPRTSWCRRSTRTGRRSGNSLCARSAWTSSPTSRPP
jgi:L-lactate dehydrogenase complex protein LldF